MKDILGTVIVAGAALALGAVGGVVFGSEMVSQVVTRTVEVEVAVVPDECVGALEAADDVISTNTRFVKLMEDNLRNESDAWLGVLEGDISALEKRADELEQLGEEVRELGFSVGRSGYDALRSACLDAEI